MRQYILRLIPAIEEQRRRGNNSMVNDLNNDWYRLIPMSFYYERDTPRSRYISTELHQFYFGNQSVGPDTYDDLAHVRKNCSEKYLVQKHIKY